MYPSFFIPFFYFLETILQTVEQTTEATTNPPLHQPNSTTSTHSNQTKVITESNEQHTANLSAELFSVQSTSPPTLTLSTSNISTMKPVRHVVSSSEILHLKSELCKKKNSYLLASYF